MSKLRQSSGPQSLRETPLVPIEISGEKHNLRFDMRAVGRLEAELDRGILEIWDFLAKGRFSVRLVLAIIAAGIAHEYKRGKEPSWEDLGAHFEELDQVRPLIQPAMDALLPALSRAQAEPAPDPNAPAPVAE